MSLNASNTGSDIVAAVQSQLGITLNAGSQALWVAIVNALYTRIKADMVVQSVVATAIPVATAGGPSAQTGATTATGTATSNSVT